jgi:hypothetical protein
MALFLAFLVFYRLLQEWLSNREAGASISEWQSLPAIDARYGGTAPPGHAR